MNKKTKGLYCTNYREPVKKWSHVPFQVDEGIPRSNRGEPDFQGGRAAIQSSRYSSVLESSKCCIACATRVYVWKGAGAAPIHVYQGLSVFATYRYLPRRGAGFTLERQRERTFERGSR